MDRSAERNAPWDGSRPGVAQVQGLPIPSLAGQYRATCHRWQGEPRGSAQVNDLLCSAGGGLLRAQARLSPGQVSSTSPPCEADRIGQERVWSECRDGNFVTGKLVALAISR